MEPMTLGSPVGSPIAQSPTSPFLPGYLMGDPQPQPSSPSKTPRQVHFATNLSSAMATPTSLTPGPTSLNDSLSRFQKNQTEKSGGPPTVGLFDTLEVNPAVVTPTSGQVLQTSQPPYQQQAHSRLGTPTNQCSQAVEDAKSWVTVFGFPPAAASSVLGHFSQVGHILEHRFPGQGNWVNLCYQTKLDASRALSYNGKVLGGHTMIGVVPCRDHLLPGNALKDMTNMLSGSGTPVTPKSPLMARQAQRHTITSPTSSPYLTPTRPLRQQMVFSSPTENEVVPAQNTPTKSTSFVTRAVDYVFGL